ncbi:pilus assembly protein [Arthrobacter sp. GN70]|uniref:TadE-like domain-containing protein n=1 Tax=Arthrobacter terricola TaxID=2547396 RepID=A0A4R5KI96_9MICC|nr:pilus assembly protein [Arthrobacter sp. GN70]TDF93970.1 hypothetical protein E1809_15095 [Arthrobacter terricola]
MTQVKGHADWVAVAPRPVRLPGHPVKLADQPVKSAAHPVKRAAQDVWRRQFTWLAAKRSPKRPSLSRWNLVRRRKSRATPDLGAVTAEFAVTLPAVLLLLALLLAGSSAGITQLRLEEAAKAGARALARGDGNAAVEGIVRKLAGDAASTIVAEDGGWIVVTVSAKVAGPLGSLIPWKLSAVASAKVEMPQGAAGSMSRTGAGAVDFNGPGSVAGLQPLVKESAA